MPIRHVGVNHIALNVRDLEESVSFYQRLFQADVIPVGAGDTARHAFLDLGYMLLELLESENLPHTEHLADGELGQMHLCFEVADIEAERETLGRLGITLTRGYAEFENLALGRIGYVFFRDPDGHELQLAQTLTHGTRPQTAVT
jgi:catechol 2,3-dioxygenase-like lactoylglutathione lyase family enzyme